MKDTYITTMYEYCYRMLSGDREYEFIPTPKEQVIIDNFHLFQGQLDLWNYFSHQFNYWSKLNYSHGFNISYILGKKAIERWQGRPITYKWDKISFEAYDKYYFETEVQVAESHEARIKKTYDRLHPFPQCIDTTTLYNPDHSICKNCLDRVTCKQVLIANFYNIALRRKLITT